MPADNRRAGRHDRPLVQRSIVSDALVDPDERARIGFDPDPATPVPLVVELNLRHAGGLNGAREQFLTTFRAALPDRPDPEPIADTYYRCELDVPGILGPGRRRPARARPGQAGGVPGLARLPGAPAGRRLLRHRQGGRRPSVQHGCRRL